MAERTVKIGGMTYRRGDVPDGADLWAFALAGSTVDVHADDVERFDRLNALTGPVAITEPVTAEDEPTEPVGYSEMTVAALKAEIDQRNEGRDEEFLLPKDGNKLTLIAALEADDESE